MRAIVALLFLVSSFSAGAFQPRTGQWWNPAESGTGYNIEIQNNVLVLTVYSYTGEGTAQWYLASGPMTNAQHGFSAQLEKYANGNCVSCAYAGRPTLTGTDGAISINFTSESAALLTLPNGRTTPIQPFDFGFGEPPQGLLGEWVYVYDVITTFADRYDYTVMRAATANGNGTVWDDARDAACELQVAGALAGNVACFQFSAAGSILNSYVYVYGLDETDSGDWFATSTGGAFAMKGFRIKGASGFAKSTVSAPSGGDPTKAAQVAAAAPSVLLPVPELAEMKSLAGAMRATRQ